MRRICIAPLFAFLLVAADAPQGPIPSSEAASRMTVPPGFSVKLFAAEPDVRQPIAFTIDPRGRLWVVECYAYPFWLGGPDKTDRVVILEDTDGDGKADSRKIFWEGGTNVTGIALGFGGVYLSATPNLLFIPDKNGDDKPDSEPQIELDGWDIKAQHNMFNALTWGPDGWLWGCNGIMSNSMVGRPGSAEKERVSINCGVWRFHPTKKVFEAIAHGTTNPWGLDFDEHGEGFITNCVIPHLYRVIPGAHFERMYGNPMIPHTYRLITTTADHIHWAGGKWTDSRGGLGKHGEAGGGHAHVGAMIYLGDNWPDAYRGSVYTCNLHGHRVNRDSLERSGSGFVAKHTPDFLMANDEWFRGLELKYGPDGSVYLTDWTDIGECHDTDADNAHRENGRIYKVSYGEPKRVVVDLEHASDLELANYHLHKNEWYARTAKRLFNERALNRPIAADAIAVLNQLLASKETAIRLRALWTLEIIGGATKPDLTKLIDDNDEWLRYWSVKLLLDRGTPSDETIAKFTSLAKNDPSPLVRLSLASALQKLPEVQCWPIAEGLASHSEDANDQSLPLMIWYGISQHVSGNLDLAMGLASRSKIPLLREFLARRAVESNLEGGIAAALKQIGEVDDPESRKDVLGGILSAIEGRKRINVPASWDQLYRKLSNDKDPLVGERVDLLALRFGDKRASANVLKTLLDDTRPKETRLRALAASVECREAGIQKNLLDLINDKDLRGEALKSLAAFNQPEIADAILAKYHELDDAAKVDAISVLVERPSWAHALLKAIDAKIVPRTDLTPGNARQIVAFKNADLTKQLEASWGTIRSTSKEKKSLIARYKETLSPQVLSSANLENGRALYKKSCAQCHKLFDDGGDVGPELTGSDRANLDYILENVLDPSASVGRDYKVTNLATKDGRLVSGILKESTPAAYVIRTANERVVIGRDDVEEVQPSDKSMMPEGLFEPLAAGEIRDLIGYLAAKIQVPTKP